MKPLKELILPILTGLFTVILIADCIYGFLSKDMLFLLFAAYTPVMFLTDLKEWKKTGKRRALFSVTVSFLILLAFIVRIISILI